VEPISFSFLNIGSGTHFILIERERERESPVTKEKVQSIKVELDRNYIETLFY
jgi:hypothetical protein